MKADHRAWDAVVRIEEFEAWWADDRPDLIAAIERWAEGCGARVVMGCFVGEAGENWKANCIGIAAQFPDLRGTAWHAECGRPGAMIGGIDPRTADADAIVPELDRRSRASIARLLPLNGSEWHEAFDSGDWARLVNPTPEVDPDAFARLASELASAGREYAEARREFLYLCDAHDGFRRAGLAPPLALESQIDGVQEREDAARKRFWEMTRAFREAHGVSNPAEAKN